MTDITAVVHCSSCRNLQIAQRLAEPHLYGALCLLVDEAGFLLEPKAAALIEKLPAVEGKMVAAESIVRALGVTDGPAFDALIDALSADGGAGAASREATSLSGGGRAAPGANAIHGICATGDQSAEQQHL